MCFEKQRFWWLLETHVAFRGGVYEFMEAPLPRLGFAAARIFVITGFHHPYPVSR